MYDISLNDFVYEERDRAMIKDSHIFNHFCGLRGYSRYINMKKYVKRDLFNCTSPAKF